MNFTKIELLLVTGSNNTWQALSKQLNQYFGNSLTIHPYIIDDLNKALDKKYFTVFSSEEVFNIFLEQGHKDYLTDYIIAERTIMYDNLDKILFLPRNQEILFVNDSRLSAVKCVEYLSNLGFDFIKFVPYYPGCDLDISNINVAITPGEMDKVPSGLSSVYDIGVRIMDFSTIVKILSRYKILDKNIKSVSDIYTQGLMDLARRIADAAEEKSKSLKNIRRELIGSGYYAKYRFKDIVGKSDGIARTKEIAKKLAKTDLTVLIEGENGTGKELFASAIHNASERRKEPFVAINVSALPDELIESELFGYEEGSFTGAKRGGKTGLFQQADRGTIFLDEIGDISPKMQSKLLRVIQEKEIMKVGGNSIIPVDVRIIATTNRDLNLMIKKNMFRKDLYYRLKEGYIHVPPLSARKEDIPLLIDDWIKKRATHITKIEDSVIQVLKDHNWPGNVRELYNVIKYATAISDTETIKISDLLDEYIIPLERRKYGDKKVGANGIIILRAIVNINEKGEIAGRRKIYDQLRKRGYGISEYRIRLEINKLIDNKYIRQEKGRYGLIVTPLGFKSVSS